MEIIYKVEVRRAISRNSKINYDSWDAVVDGICAKPSTAKKLIKKLQKSGYKPETIRVVMFVAKQISIESLNLIGDPK